MARILMLAGFLVLLGSGADAQEPSTPPIVLDGLRAVTASGIDSAWSVWTRGSSLEGNEAAAGQVAEPFHRLPEWFGKPVGFEILKNFTIGSHVTRTYAILLFDGGPMYLRFTYYLGSKGWSLQYFDFNSDAKEILPANMLLP